VPIIKPTHRHKNNTYTQKQYGSKKQYKRSTMAQALNREKQR